MQPACRHFLSIAFMAYAATIAEGAGYSVTPVGVGPAQAPVVAFGINKQGQVVGAGPATDATEHAFLWQASSGMVDLGVLPGDLFSGAISINDSGQVVGTSQAAGGQPPHGFLWQAGSGMTDIGASAGLYTQASSINNQGVVIGVASSAPDFSENVFPFTYTSAAGIAPVSVPGLSVTDIYAVNSSGQMVVDSPSSPNLLFITPGETPVEIQGTGNLVGGAARAMNDAGTVVGFIDPSNGEQPHGFVWNQATGFVDLGVGVAEAVNALDDVVGFRTLADGSSEGYLYEDGNFYDLSTLLDASGAGWGDLNPMAINDEGQIAGNGLYDGQYEAFLLTPTGDGQFAASGVPEPASLALLAFGAAVLFRRRRGGARAAKL
jgi:probable HAF family extracellular repeat protein